MDVPGLKKKEKGLKIGQSTFGEKKKGGDE